MTAKDFEGIVKDQRVATVSVGEADDENLEIISITFESGDTLEFYAQGAYPVAVKIKKASEVK